MCLHKDPSTYSSPNVQTLTYVNDHIMYCKMAWLSIQGLWVHKRKSCGNTVYRFLPIYILPGNQRSINAITNSVHNFKIVCKECT